MRWVYGGTRFHDRVATFFDIETASVGGEQVQRATWSMTKIQQFAAGNDSDVFSHRYDIVLDLDSRDTDDTCTALSGSLSFSAKFEQIDAARKTYSWAAVRDADDERWKWASVEDGVRAGGEARRLSNRFYCGFDIGP